MKRISNTFLILIAMCISTAAGAQDAEMADGMRSNGKIYVVVGIIVIVLAGLFTYLFMTDRKLTRIEKQLQEKR